MASASERQKRELISDLAQIAIERTAETESEEVRPERPKEIEWFVRQCYSPISIQDIAFQDPQVLAEAALSLWEWGLKRAPGEHSIRSYHRSRAVSSWDSPSTVFEVISDDMPFLLESVKAAVHTLDHSVNLTLYPVVEVSRNAAGCLKRLAIPEEGVSVTGTVREMYLQIEVERITDAGEVDQVLATIEGAVTDVRATVEDWQPMRQKLAEIIASWQDHPPPVSNDEIAEAASFLHWLDDEHFVFLGYREIDLVEEQGKAYLRWVPESSLGVLRVREALESQHLRPLTEKMSEFARKPQLIFVTKANHRATVHRPSHMDVLVLKKFDSEGHVTGEQRFFGLFSSVTYNRRARTIPLLREKVERTVVRAGFPPNSHDSKALVQILETFPRDELFQIDEDRLFEISLGILQLQERQRIALFERLDPFERFISCLVYVPRDRYSTELRLSVQGVLEEAFAGKMTAYYTQVTDSALARIHWIVKTEPGNVPEYSIKDLEFRVAEATRTWRDHLYEGIMAAPGGLERSQRSALFLRYQDAFPISYKECFTVDQALIDMHYTENVLCSNLLGVHLYRLNTDGPRKMHFKIYERDQPISPSDILPRLENMGIRVDSETLYEIKVMMAIENPRSIYIHHFVLETNASAARFERLVEVLPDTFHRIHEGDVDDDGFNRLVVAAGFAWHEVVVLRAYAKFLRQARSAFSEAYMQDSLAGNPRFADQLAALFKLRFDPDQSPEERESRTHEVMRNLESSLMEVRSLDEDRILRRFLNLIKSTLRTNYFQRTEEGERKSYLSLKLASGDIKVLPRPRPLYEIFVYSPRVEAVHLRGGHVARGGVRWSDRKEDFRTEILGLMKAQMVKNAVIVPVGAKGGFIVKRPPVGGDREALIAEGIECYRIMIRGLLDLTDNLVDGAVVPPERVLRIDGDDPYLVVAADKGTATFSDIANQLALDHGFWLGDAFASGGSAGYDHKAMGITARGAWVAVERHFRELGVDIRSQDFTVVGVGDMSGDVFGNGMLLSRHIRLVGAFNHLHVFVDPDPDPEVSFEERKRLFELPRSTWDDYDRSKMSAGAQVFDRNAKSVELTPEIRDLLGIQEESVPPNRLVRALLTHRCDLLWFGGIGTFVKSSDESDAQTGDRANDAVRVDASDLRCKVLGEGANLGITQRGRIELNENGGLLNTDFIDNGCGISLSDAQVNLQLFSRRLNETGYSVDTPSILRSIKDELSSQIVRNQQLTTTTLTLSSLQIDSSLYDYKNLLSFLEKNQVLDRSIEFLPDDEEFSRLASSGKWLTRPELAQLLFYSQNWLKTSLGPKNLQDSILRDMLLRSYFPRPIVRDYSEQLKDHPIAAAIVVHQASFLVTRILGPTAVPRISTILDCDPAEVVRCFFLASWFLDLARSWQRIDLLSHKIPIAAQISLYSSIASALEQSILILVRQGFGRGPIVEHQEKLRLLKHTIQSVAPKWLESLNIRDEAISYIPLGLPTKVARKIGLYRFVASGLELVPDAMNLTESVLHYLRLLPFLEMTSGISSIAGILKTIMHQDWSIDRTRIDEIHRNVQTFRSTITSNCISPQRETHLVTSMPGHPQVIESLRSLSQAQFPSPSTLVTISRRLAALTPA